MKKTGIEEIAVERAEQVSKHSKTVAEDAHLHPNGELKEVAVGLLTDGYKFPEHLNQEQLRRMNAKTYRERLIIAGAFIAAEIDRVDFVEEQKSSSNS